MERIRKGVIILVYNKDNYLIVKQKNGSWSLPSGGIEEGESEVDAAKRELFEETGINGNNFIPTSVYNEFKYDETTSGLQKGFLLEYLQLSIPGAQIENEILDTKWVNAIEAKEYLLKPNQYKVFEKLANSLLSTT